MEHQIEQIRQEMRDHRNHVDKQICEISKDLKDMRGNHLWHMERSLASMQTDMSWIKSILEKTQKNDQEQVKEAGATGASVQWLTWAVQYGLAAVIGAGLTIAVGLLTKK